MCSHRGDSNEYTKYFQNEKRKSPFIIPNLQLWDIFQETQERVRNIRGNRTISVRATEVLLYCYVPARQNVGDIFSRCILNLAFSDSTLI